MWLTCWQVAQAQEAIWWQACKCVPTWEQGTAVANSAHFNRRNLLVTSAKEGVHCQGVLPAWQYDNPACSLYWDSWSIVVVG